MHHHTVQINQQTRRNIFSSFYLTFMYSSTCFGHPHAHHQELNNCSSSLWFYRWSVVIAVLLVVVWPAGRPVHDQQHCYHYVPMVNQRLLLELIRS
jgi:nitric oxide reductase large subunit